MGLADAVAPGVNGALWLTRYPPDADPGTAAGTAQQVSIAGVPIGPQLKLPAGYLIEQGTTRGLLLAPLAPRLGTVADELWDTASVRASRTFAAVIAVSSTQIAWTPSCATRCRVLVLNLATGRQETAGLPEGRSVAAAAFSPEADDGGQAVQLELESMASGHLMAVPGTWLSSDALISFGWPTSSDSLIAELAFTTKVQLTLWRQVPAGWPLRYSGHRTPPPPWSSGRTPPPCMPESRHAPAGRPGQCTANRERLMTAIPLVAMSP
ncbi:MAG TPA: hypothetical protein VHY58_07610 [Streptosporangiaceae bacterium]|nr:hypothetical protein [Streptosporangiaceae bacterium]